MADSNVREGAFPNPLQPWSESPVDHPIPHWWLLCLGMALGFLALDYLTGPYILFPITFVLPVILASWKLGLRSGILLAIGLVGAQFLLRVFWAMTGYSMSHEVVNSTIHMVVFLSLAWMTSRIAEQDRELSRRVRVLEGMLPICCVCKKIRRSDGKWEQIEKYITERSEAKFSHGLCEACLRAQYPELFGPGAES